MNDFSALPASGILQVQIGRWIAIWNGRCVFGEAGLTNRNVSEVRSVSSSSLRDLATSESQNGLKIVRRTLMGLSFSTAAAPPVSQIFDLASKSGGGAPAARRAREVFLTAGPGRQIPNKRPSIFDISTLWSGARARTQARTHAPSLLRSGRFPCRKVNPSKSDTLPSSPPPPSPSSIPSLPSPSLPSASFVGKEE